MGAQVDSIQSVLADIGLTNDKLVTAVTSQETYKMASPTMRELIRSFPEMKRRTLLDTFTKDNSV